MTTISIGYAVTSTARQTGGIEAQVLALKEAGCSVVFQEQVSTRVKEKQRTQLQAALSSLEKGDEVVVSNLDRLGRTNPGGGGFSSSLASGAGSPCPNPGRTGEYEGSGEVRPGADRTAVWFGGSGTVADSGAHPGVDPAPQGNRRQSWRSSQNQPKAGASGAASPGGGVLLSIHQEPDRHRAGNHSTNNFRGGSGGVIRPLALAESTTNF